MKRYALLLALVASFILVKSAAANLVVNGGFETGSFSGWTRSGETYISFVDDGYNPYFHSGDWYAAFSPQAGMGYISQDLVTTAGASYNLSFWVRNYASLTPNEFLAQWDGDTLVDLVDTGGFGYTQYSFIVTAATSSTTLTFGFYNPNTYFFLDDVSVDPVPLPATILLLGLGLIGLGGLRRFRKG
jgi:hypothetical protein